MAIDLNITGEFKSNGVATQPTLVSGTNIKTINGTSVLGSGNLVVGGSGIHAIVKPIGSGATTFINAALNDSPTPPVLIGQANKIYLVPFIPAQNVTYTQLSCFTIANAGGNFRILIYSNVNDLPSAKIFESSSLSAYGTGFQTALTSGTFIKDTCYWIGVYASTNSCMLECYDLSSLLSITNSGGENCNAATITQTFGTAPSTITASNVSFLRGYIPIVQIS